jgi:hypothetical protein
MRVESHRMIVWWKMKHLMLSTKQMHEVGLLGENRQLRLWL